MIISTCVLCTNNLNTISNIIIQVQTTITIVYAKNQQNAIMEYRADTDAEY